MLLLVGDNAFHGISHLSQERARSRGSSVTAPEYAAGLVRGCVEGGAEGFLFSVSETTLSILRRLRREGIAAGLGLYPIVPYAYEYVSLATRAGVMGIGRKVLAQSMSSSGLGTVAKSLRGALSSNPVALLEAYLGFELSRVRAAVEGQVVPRSLLLHEMVTDMALAFGMDWLFRGYVRFLREQDVLPGFETRNFALLVRRLTEWGLAYEGLVVAAPFNRVGFQMSPSREACERALTGVKGLQVVAMSVLAAGYLGLGEALEYVASLPGLAGVAVGVSKPEQALETFAALRARFQAPMAESK